MITLLQVGVLPEATITGLKKQFVVRQLPVELSDRALLYALDNHYLAGAGLDVFQHEPHVSIALRTHPRVVLSPHAASGTIQTRQKMAEHVVNTLENFFKR